MTPSRSFATSVRLSTRTDHTPRDGSKRACVFVSCSCIVSCSAPTSVGVSHTGWRVSLAGDRKYTSKIEALEARKAPFIWHAHWQEGDAFDMMLQELYSKLRFMRNSPYRFWVKPLPTG
jgi:hypothetical protein